MVRSRIEILEELFINFLSKASTGEVKEILNKHILDLDRTAKYLDVSQPRVHKMDNTKLPESVIGKNHYLLRDLEVVKTELHNRRKRYGTGWSRSGSEWTFSQENVLKTIIKLFNEGNQLIALKDIIENLEIDQDMTYKDKSVRILFALNKLITHGAVERIQRGAYRPTNPSTDIKKQIPVTRESYVYDAGDFEPENVLKVLKQMGGAGINISSLCKKLMEDTDENIEPDKAKYLTRKALKKLMQQGSVLRDSRGVYITTED